MLRTSRYLIALSLLALLAAPAGAELFTITLQNGSTFTSRYQPVQSATDEGKLQFLTDYGNWITLKKDTVSSIQSRTESKGFGVVLDTQTIALGWDPTSIQEAEDAEAPEDPTAQLLRYLVEQDQAQATAPAPAPYSNDLVVEPKDAGGIPMWMTGTAASPLGRR